MLHIIYKGFVLTPHHLTSASETPLWTGISVREVFPHHLTHHLTHHPHPNTVKWWVRCQVRCLTNISLFQFTQDQTVARRKWGDGVFDWFCLIPPAVCHSAGGCVILFSHNGDCPFCDTHFSFHFLFYHAAKIRTIFQSSKQFIKESADSRSHPLSV